MAGIADALSRHTIVGIDTPVFIYELENIQPFATPARVVFRSIQQGSIAAVTSVVTLMELAVRPLRFGRTDLARAYWHLLGTYPHLAIISVDRVIAQKAAEIRASASLSSTDALQAATSVVAGATAFLTNDSQLRRVGGIEVPILGDYPEA